MENRNGKLALLVMSVCALLVISPMSAWANPHEDKKSVDERVRELQREHEDLGAEMARTIAEKEEAEARLPAAQELASQAQEALARATRKDEELRARLASAQSTQSELEDNVRAGEEAIAQSQRATVAVGRQAYKNAGVTSDVALAIQMAQGEGGAEGLVRIDSTVRAQQRSLSRLSAQRAQDEQNRELLAGITQEVTELKDESAKHVTQLKSVESEALAARADIDQLVALKDGASKRIEEARATVENQLSQQRADQERLAQEIAEFDRRLAEETPSNPVVGSSVLANPAPGFGVTSPFGYRIHPITHVRRLHTGTDFGTPCGTPIQASADGRVVSAGMAGGYGLRVVITHGRMGDANIATTYSHNSSMKVSAGDQVKAGQIISLSGTTGASTGCHLHFEVLKDGEYVDPMPYIS